MEKALDNQIKDKDVSVGGRKRTEDVLEVFGLELPLTGKVNVKEGAEGGAVKDLLALGHTPMTQ